VGRSARRSLIAPAKYSNSQRYGLARPRPNLTIPFRSIRKLHAVLLCILAFWSARLSAQGIQRPIIQARQDLRISAEAEDLSWIMALAVDSGGRMIVAQPEDSYFLVFDSTGKRLARFGREGDGPGEFRRITIGRGWVENRFWQYDLITRRITFYRMPGQLQRSALLQPSGAAASGISLLIPYVIAVLADGSMLAWSPIVRAGKPAAWAANLSPSAGTAVIHVSPQGAPDRLVAAWPAIKEGCDQEVNGRIRPIPECQDWFWSISPHGQHLAYADVSERSDGQVVTVTSLTQTGDTVFAKRIPLVPLAIEHGSADSIRAHWIAGAKTPELKQDWRDIRLPKYFVSMKGLVAADDGTIWVQLRNGHKGFLWHEIAPDGRSERLWRLPNNVRLDVVTDNYLYVIETDEIGFDNVVRYVR
jgi:hypothetical protein